MWVCCRICYSHYILTDQVYVSHYRGQRLRHYMLLCCYWKGGYTSYSNNEKMWFSITKLKACLYFVNAFSMVISNTVMKLNNFEDFVKFLTCRLLTPAAWEALIHHVSTIKTGFKYELTIFARCNTMHNKK